MPKKFNLHAMPAFSVPQFVLSSLLVITSICLAGCGVGTEQIVDLARSQLDQQQSSSGSLAGGIPGDIGAGNASVLEEVLGDNVPSTGEDKELLVSAPFPNRKNPFEFAMEVDFEKSATSEGELQIKLYGFVGTNNPKAVINVNGTTKMLSQGETWGKLELLEVHPPEIKLRAEGVTRTWSLLGHSGG